MLRAVILVEPAYILHGADRRNIAEEYQNAEDSLEHDQQIAVPEPCAEETGSPVREQDKKGDRDDDRKDEDQSGDEFLSRGARFRLFFRIIHIRGIIRHFESQ